MKHSSALAARRDASRRLKNAVQQHPTISRNGLQERLFTLVFSGLVYPQIWEDPEVDREALRIEPDSHVVTIASGGCNVLSYLLDKPRKLTALDLNRAHVSLTRLKLTAAERLTDFEQFYSFFGQANDAANTETYKTMLRDSLDETARKFWDGRSLTGRRRIGLFERNLYAHGTLGYFITIAHFISRWYGVDPKAILDCGSLEDQQAFFEDKLAPIFQRKPVRWLTSKTASLYLLGIPPKQYRALVGDGAMSDVLCERLKRLACDFDLADNYFAWQAFGMRYAERGQGTPPPYLQRHNFETLRETANRVDLYQKSFTEFLAGEPAQSADCYVLLDAQDWMNDDQINALWREITRTARPGARVIFRTAAEPSLLPGRLADTILSRWTYEEDASCDYTNRDRSSIYGGFHLYTLREATA